MEIKEFVENGLLQEVNRTFFHPRGLSLVVQIEQSSGEYFLSHIDQAPESDELGYIFDFESRTQEQRDLALLKAHQAAEYRNKYFNKRIEQFGTTIEPIKNFKDYVRSE